MLADTAPAVMFMHLKSSDSGGGGGGGGCGRMTVTTITATITPTVTPAESMLAVTAIQDEATFSGADVIAIISYLLHSHVRLWPGSS